MQGRKIGAIPYIAAAIQRLNLKGLSHELDLAFDDMHGQLRA
jgi:hypothetical protein